MRTLSSTLQHLLCSGLLLVSMISAPITVLAQAGNIEVIPKNWNTGDCDIVTGKLKAACIPMFVGHIVEIIFSLISAFFLLNVIYAGYQMAMGSWTGDKANGKDRLTWSIIGLVISVCAFLILDLVVSVVLP